MPAQELLPLAIAEQLPILYATDGQGNEAIAYVKFFTPWSDWTWYATEYDPDERRFFDLVVGLEVELGYFDLGEVAAVRAPGGLRIERDEYWTPRPLKECRQGGMG